MTEDFDWTSLKKSNVNAPRIEKDTNVSESTSTTLEEKSSEKSQKIKRNRQPKEDASDHHATLYEMEIQIATYGGQLGNLILDVETMKAQLKHPVSPDIWARIMVIMEYLAKKIPNKNGIARVIIENAQTILEALK